MEGEQQQQKEDGAQQHQHLILAHKLFFLKHHDVSDIDKLRLKEEIFCSILSNDMASLYETLAADSVLEMDLNVLVSMRKRIDEEIKKLDEKCLRKMDIESFFILQLVVMNLTPCCSCRIADAEENLGESEVREAHLAKSVFFIKIADKEKALEQLKLTESKTVAVGQKMDLVFHTLHIAFFYMDFDNHSLIIFPHHHNCIYLAWILMRLGDPLLVLLSSLAAI